MTCTILIGEVILVHVLEAVTARTAHNHVIVDLDKYAQSAAWAATLTHASQSTMTSHVLAKNGRTAPQQ